jgi:hypothetical protein
LWKTACDPAAGHVEHSCHDDIADEGYGVLAHIEGGSIPSCILIYYRFTDKTRASAPNKCKGYLVPVPKVSFVTKVGELGSGGYYK